MLTRTQAEYQGHLFSAFLHEIVQFEGLTVTRNVALTFEHEVTDNLEATIDVACIPALHPSEYDGEVMNRDDALKALRSMDLAFQPRLPHSALR